MIAQGSHATFLSAALAGDTPTVQMLLDFTDPDVRDGLALALAAYAGRVSTVHALLDAGATPTPRALSAAAPSVIHILLAATQSVGAIDAPVPAGTPDDAAWLRRDAPHTIVPGQTYFMCTDSTYTHYFDATVYAAWCARQRLHAAVGDRRRGAPVGGKPCLLCPVCSHPMNPQLWRS